MKDFIKREKGVLAGILLVVALTIAFGIFVTRNNSETDSDFLFWIEAIGIGFLINLLCSFVMIAFFDDKEKRENLERERYILKRISADVARMADVLINFYNAAADKPLETAEQKTDLVLHKDFETFIKPKLMTLNLSLRTAPYFFGVDGSTNKITQANWLEYFYHVATVSIEDIQILKYFGVPFIPEEFYAPIDSFISLLVLLNSRKNVDNDFVRSPDYSENYLQRNSKESLNFFAEFHTVVLNLRAIDDCLKKESSDLALKFH